MSDQAQSSKLVELSILQFTNDMWHWNPARNHNLIVKEDGPKPKTIDVWNGHDQELALASSSQSLLLSSPEDIDNYKSEIRTELNPIGALQELCLARHFPYPVYTFSVENVKKQNPRFIVKCSISIYTTTSTGPNKKGAKKQAAYEMYKQIKKLPTQVVHKNIDIECEKKDPSHKTGPSLCPESETLLNTFFGLTGAPKTPNFLSVENKCELTAADTLKIISEREKFAVRCIVVSQKSDKVDVLMKADTAPQILISESGENVNDAQESAAYVILTYLKYNFIIRQ